MHASDLHRRSLLISSFSFFSEGDSLADREHCAKARRSPPRRMCMNRVGWSYFEPPLLPCGIVAELALQALQLPDQAVEDLLLLATVARRVCFSCSISRERRSIRSSTGSPAACVGRARRR